MSIPADQRTVGTRVSYEDQANPRQVGTITAVLDRCAACVDGVVHPTGARAGVPCPVCSGTGERVGGPEYEVAWNDEAGTTVSDLRQHGWNLVAGDSWSGTPFEGADIIAVYSRAQAIEDGELVDVSEQAQEAGIKFPVALTRAVWVDCVEWDASNGALQDESGRLWDVVWMLRCEIARQRGGDRVEYEILRVPNEPAATGAVLTQLVAVCGPGDHAEPVITVMAPGES